MFFLFVKAAISGVLVALSAEVALRYVGWGALIASLPLVSVLGMIWLWRDTGDVERLADYSLATVWYVLPSLPMFMVIPLLLRGGFGFWLSLAIGCALTMVLYTVTVWIASRFGFHL